MHGYAREIASLSPLLCPDSISIILFSIKLAVPKRRHQSRILDLSNVILDSSVPDQAEAASAPIRYGPRFASSNRPPGDALKPAVGKNPHAPALSALGAAKCGKARATKLSERRQKTITKKAAR
jgi:hypothetical protein